MHVSICFSLLMGCYYPQRPDWSDKDAGFLIAKLESWHPDIHHHAIWYLEDKMEQRDRIIAALTHTLLNDTHEIVLSYAAQGLRGLAPPAVEALPALKEASNLPENDRGKPVSGQDSFVAPLPQEAGWAVESITVAQKARKSIEESGPPPIESSGADGESDVDTAFINGYGITLRLPPELPDLGYCIILDPDRRTVWRESFTAMERDVFVTLKPGGNDPRLVHGTVYVIEVYGKYRGTPYLITRFTFSTKD